MWPNGSPLILLHYRIARLLDRQGHLAEALDYYERARDGDICPLRIIKPVEESLLRIAADTSTPLVDAAKLISADSPDRIPGYVRYLDHVHPTIGGHQQIARALADKLRTCGLVSTNTIWVEENRRAVYSRHLDDLGQKYLVDGQQRVIWLENWARRKRLSDETLPKDAAGFVRLGMRQLDLGDDADALQSFTKAINLDALSSEMIGRHARELVAQGRPRSAGVIDNFIATHRHARDL